MFKRIWNKLKKFFEDSLVQYKRLPTCPCGKEVAHDYSECRICGEPVCEGCQAQYTEHSQIDYDCHEGCLDYECY